MRVLVTGGAGYIGSHAARALRDAGHEIRILDDLSSGHRAALPPGVSFVFGDLAIRRSSPARSRASRPSSTSRAS